MYNILKRGKYRTLKPSFCIYFPRHTYLVRNSIEMLFQFPRVEPLRMSFKYEFVKVWLESPEFIKCQRAYQQFEIDKSKFYLAQF